MLTAKVTNADRMMTSARALNDGIELAFADGCAGTVPFTDIPGIHGIDDIDRIDLPNAFELILHKTNDETIELPWDFVRHYCDASYKPRVEDVALAGRKHLGEKIRRVREDSHLTQEELAHTAGIGRVTLVRIENGEQSPRYDTLLSLSRALDRPLPELLGA